MLGGLLSVDIILLVTWHVVDPLRRKIEPFALELPPFGDEDAMIKPELEHCESEHNSLWLGECDSRLSRKHACQDINAACLRQLTIILL